MKIDFDKFNLSQKILSILGLISAIVIYMGDKDNLNIAIGIIFLIAITVFLLRYKYIKITLYILISLIISAVIYIIVNEQLRNTNIPSSLSINKNKYQIELTDDRKFEAEADTTAEEVANLYNKKIEEKEIKNASLVNIVEWSFTGDSLEAIFFGHKVICTLQNTSSSPVQRIDLMIYYYNADGNYLINKEVISDFTKGEIIAPKSKATFSQMIKLNIPNQETVKKLGVYKASVLGGIEKDLTVTE
jgi:hypothetical protein